jgi:hypothetical protein
VLTLRAAATASSRCSFAAASSLSRAADSGAICAAGGLRTCSGTTRSTALLQVGVLGLQPRDVALYLRELRRERVGRFDLRTSLPWREPGQLVGVTSSAPLDQMRRVQTPPDGGELRGRCDRKPRPLEDLPLYSAVRTLH